MEHMINPFVPSLFFIVLGALVGKLVYLLVLLPYRTKIACWYMRRFSPHYKIAKNVFDELLKKYEEIKANKKTVRESYAEFYYFLENDSRFRGSESVCIENILHDSHFNDCEIFVFFQGEGVSLHKIFVGFNFLREIHLRSIELLYSEEKGRDSYLYSIEMKEFPPDESGNSAKPPTVDPVLELAY